MIAKNRDWRPDQNQILKIVKPAEGYEYLGLFAEGDDDPGLKAGINRKGLVIISASASSIPRIERKQVTGKRGVMKMILETYASVDEVLKDQNLFLRARPSFLMIADKRSIVCVEIGLNNRYSLTRQDNGTISHTNHYLSPSLLADNRKIGKSSRKRLEEIQAWLSHPLSGFSLADYIHISEDRSNGPNDSILRTGGAPGAERTMATWITALPRRGIPKVYIKLRNPGVTERVFNYRLDDAFWRQTELAQ